MEMLTGTERPVVIVRESMHSRVKTKKKDVLWGVVRGVMRNKNATPFRKLFFHEGDAEHGKEDMGYRGRKNRRCKRKRLARCTPVKQRPPRKATENGSNTANVGNGGITLGKKSLPRPPKRG